MSDLDVDVGVNSSSGQSEEEAQSKNHLMSSHELGEEPLPLDSPEFLVKHPLQNKWTIWFFKPERNIQYEECQKPIITVSTVEDFWALYNHIELASNLNVGCDYALFKEGIKPMWEDKANASGGRWVINLDKKQRGLLLDKYWLEIMLCLIGEYFDQDSNHINGAVLNVRPKGDKIGIWMKDDSASRIVLGIGKKVKEKFHIDPNTKLMFESHDANQKKMGSTTKTLYSI